MKKGGSSREDRGLALTLCLCSIFAFTTSTGSKPGALSIELRARMKAIRHLEGSIRNHDFHVCTMWKSFSWSLPYRLPGRVGKHHGFDVVLARVVVPLEDGKGLVTRNRHDAFVIPSFLYLSGHKGMTEIMKAQVRHNSVSKKSDSRFRS